MDVNSQIVAKRAVAVARWTSGPRMNKTTLQQYFSEAEDHKAMSQVEKERLDCALQQAQADLEKAERLLVADPTDEFAQMSVELFRSEVESFRQIRAATP